MIIKVKGTVVGYLTPEVGIIEVRDHNGEPMKVEVCSISCCSMKRHCTDNYKDTFKTSKGAILVRFHVDYCCGFGCEG